jgi:hypothetical protein
LSCCSVERADPRFARYQFRPAVNARDMPTNDRSQCQAQRLK